MSAKDSDAEDDDDAAALLSQPQNDDDDPVSDTGRGSSTTSGRPHPRKRGPILRVVLDRDALRRDRNPSSSSYVRTIVMKVRSLVLLSFVFFKSHRSFLAGLTVALSFLVGFRSFLGRWEEHVRSSAARRSGNELSRDYATVEGLHDLTSDFLEPWCYSGMEQECTCTDPMTPVDRSERRHWDKATHLNKDLAMSAAGHVDVVFLGDSITEGWRGTAYSNIVGRKSDIPPIFESYFTIKGGGKFEGIALGISGDTSMNLLFRIQHGEIPSNLNPPVFWLLIGTNDFGNTWCSPEAVVIGILRVVEEIRARKPGSIVVLNGLQPRTFNDEGFVYRTGKSKTRKKKTRPTIWKDVLTVNDQLKRYAANRDGVEYFETDAFFADTSVPENDLRIDPELSDFLHPTPEGYRLWGKEISDRLEHLIVHR